MIFSLLLLLRRRQWHPTPVFLPGKPYGWRSLVGCSPWGREESDMTEQLPFHFSLSCIGEGNGNPLQCYDLQSRKRKIMARKGERFSQDHKGNSLPRAVVKKRLTMRRTWIQLTSTLDQSFRPCGTPTQTHWIRMPVLSCFSHV